MHGSVCRNRFTPEIYRQSNWTVLQNCSFSTIYNLALFYSSHHQMGVLFLPGFVGYNAQVWMDRVLYPLVPKRGASHNEAFFSPWTSKTLHCLRLVTSFIYSLRRTLEWTNERRVQRGEERGERHWYINNYIIYNFFTSCFGKNLKCWCYALLARLWGSGHLHISGVNINLYNPYGGLLAITTKIINAHTLSVHNSIYGNLFYKEACPHVTWCICKVIHRSIVYHTVDVGDKQMSINTMQLSKKEGEDKIIRKDF